jgi:hypothetical protein
LIVRDVHRSHRSLGFAGLDFHLCVVQDRIGPELRVAFVCGTHCFCENLFLKATAVGRREESTHTLVIHIMKRIPSGSREILIHCL